MWYDVPMSKDKVFRFRCTEADFQVWDALAKAEHRSLSDWIRLRLNGTAAVKAHVVPTEPEDVRKVSVQVPAKTRNTVCETLGHEKFKDGDGWVCKRCGVSL